MTRRIKDAPSSIIVQFVSTYGVWMLAERAGLSPILTMVCYAMTLARSAPAYLPARLRIPSYAVWETAVLALNVLAFLVIGLELGPIIAAARPGELGRWAWGGAAGRTGPLGLGRRGRACDGDWRAAALDLCGGDVGALADQAPGRRRVR